MAKEFNTNDAPELIDKLVLVAGSNKMPVNRELIDLAESGDEKAVLLMMKWGYEGSKAFIGGNPVKKIVNSSLKLYPRNLLLNQYKLDLNNPEEIIKWIEKNAKRV